MSLILDALNKSRSDAGEVPGLGAEHYREEPPRPWLRYLPWAGLVLALLALVWLLLPGREEPAGSIVTPVAELSRNIGSAAAAVSQELQARADAGRERRAAQLPAQGEPAPPVVAPPVPVAASAQPPQDGAAPVAPASPVAKTATADPAAIEALYAERQRAGQELLERAARAKAAGAQPEPVAQEETVDVEQVLRQAQQEVANAGLVEHPAPFLVNLSQQTKNAIPTILYQRHDYNSQPGRSSVTLNGKNLRVGGSPAQGLEVDEILEDSVILSYGGTQFRLRALNSWVNL